MNEKEIRSFVSEINIKKDEDSENRTVEMRAIVFNKFSKDLGGFKEIIKPASLDEIRNTINISDIEVLYNHKTNELNFARSINGKGTLELIVDEDGVIARFEMPHQSLANDLLESIRLKNIDSCSFGFILTDDDYYFERDENGTMLKDENGLFTRVITNFRKFFDVSIVNRPAYNDTELVVRNLEELKQEELRKEISRNLIHEVEEYLKIIVKRMNKVEMQDKHVELRAQLENLLTEKENRDLNEDEQTNMRGLLNEIKDLDVKIATETEIEDLKLREEQKTATTVKIQTPVEHIENRDLTDVDKKENNKNMENDFVKRSIEANGAEVRLFVESASVNSALGETKKAAIKELVPQTLVQSMGADITYVSDNIVVPVYGKVTESDVNFVAEGVAVGEMALGVSEVTLTPKRIGVTVAIPVITEKQDSIGMSAYIQDRAFKLLASKIDKLVLSQTENTTVNSAGVFNGVETVDMLGAVMDRKALLKYSGEMIDNGSEIEKLSVIGSGAIETSFLTQELSEGSGQYLLSEESDTLRARGMNFKRSVHIADSDSVLVGDMSKIAINYFLNNTSVYREIKPRTGMVEYTFDFYIDWCNVQKEAFKVFTNVKID